MNHELPFHQDHSMGIVAFTLRNFPSSETTFVELYTIPVRTLAKFPPAGKLEWCEWRHFATSIGNHPIPSHTCKHVLYSQGLSVYGPQDTLRLTLQIYDFSLRSRKRKIQCDPSAPLPPYTVQEFPLDVHRFRPFFDITESGIIVRFVRIYVMTKDVEALTWCTSSTAA